MREGGFDAAFLAVGAQLGKRAYIPAGSAAKILDAVSLLREHGGRGAAAARSPGRGLRRRQHRDGRRPHGQAARRRGGDRRLPPHARPHARARLRGRGGRAGGRPDEVALDDQARRRRASSWSSGWSSTRPASRSRPASSRSSRPTRSCSRSARRPTSRCSTACPGSRSRTASSASDATMMTGHAGIFAGGDIVAGRAHGDGRDRPRQEGRAQHRRLAARLGAQRAAAEARARALREAQHLVLRRRAAHRAAAARARAAAVDVRGGRRRPRRVDRALRGAPLPLLRQLLLVRQLLRRLPRQRRDQARRGAAEPYAIDYDFCKGCGICVAECPCGAIELVPETI